MVGFPSFSCNYLGSLFSAKYPIATFNLLTMRNFCLGAVDIVTGLFFSQLQDLLSIHLSTGNLMLSFGERYMLLLFS
jgi:hypothetical protein